MLLPSGRSSDIIRTINDTAPYSRYLRISEMGTRSMTEPDKLPVKATLLSLHPFPHTILDRIFGPFAQTTDFITFSHPDALVERAGLRHAKVFICDYDVTLTALHQSLSLDMVHMLIRLMEEHQRTFVILTSK